MKIMIKTTTSDYSIKDFAAHMEMPPAELENLFRTFIEEFDSELSDLKAAHDNNDSKRMYSIAHNIKGIAANMEMDTLFKTCKILNDLLKVPVSATVSNEIGTNSNDGTIGSNGSTLSYSSLIHEIECQYNQVKDTLFEFYHDLRA